MNLDETGLNKVGSFKPNAIERLVFKPQKSEIIDPDENRPISDMTFNVIISAVRLQQNSPWTFDFFVLLFFV